MKLPLILVIGKPGSGKSWVSAKIAEKYKLKLITVKHQSFKVPRSEEPAPVPPAENSDEPSNNPENSGQEENTPIAAPPVLVEKIVIADFPVPILPDVQALLTLYSACGIIVDGSSLGLSASNVEILIAACKSLSETHKLVVVNLEISDSDLIKRRSTQWAHTETGLIYREEQQQAPPMQFSIQEKENAEEEEETEEPNNQSDDPMPFEFPEWESVDLTEVDKALILKGDLTGVLTPENPDELDDAMIAQKERIEKFIKNGRLIDQLKVAPKWKPMGKDVRAQLLKRTQDKEENVRKELESYNTLSPLYQDLISSLAPEQHLRIDAVQTPAALLYEYSMWHKLIGSRIVSVSNGPQRGPSTLETMTPDRAIATLLNPGDDMPQNKLSPAGTDCVVTFVDTGSRVPAVPKLSVVYKGIVYMCSSEDTLVQFEAKILYYISKLENISVAPVAETVKEDTLEQPFALGRTKKFCPITLSKNVLRAGNPDFAANYKGRYYLFSNEDTRKEFIANTDTYTKREITVPPARIALAGPPGSGKKTLINKCAHNLKIVNFEELVRSHISAIADAEIRSEVKTKFEQYQDLPKELIETVLTKLFQENKDGIALENFPRTPIDYTILTDNPLVSFDMIFSLQVEADASAKRKGYTEGFDDANIASLALVVENANAALTAVNKLGEAGPIPFLVVDANLPLRQVINAASPSFNKWISNRAALFMDTKEIQPAEARAYLEQGAVQLSEFGYLCPVSLKNKQRTFIESIGSYPVLVDDKIYFLRQQEHIKTFCENPLPYITEMYSIQYQPPRYFVVGSEEQKGNVEDVLKKLYLNLRIPRINLVDLHRCLKENREYTTSSKYNVDIGSMSSGMKSEIYEWALKLSVYKVHGFLVDSEILIEENKEKVVPNKIFEVSSQQTQNEISDIKKYYLDKFVRLWSTVPFSFKTFRDIEHELLKNIYTISEYLVARRNGAACLCVDVGFTNDDINKRLSPFGLYCPVTYMEHHELIMTKLDEFYIEYQNVLYRTRSHSQTISFLANPAKYTTNLVLPDSIPEQVDSKSKTSAVKFKGYCPVSFASGVLLPGSSDYLAEFADEIYAMASEDGLDTFLKAPWKFVNQTLPDDIPESILNQACTNYALTDYFKNTLSGPINQAMLHLAKSKPKFPYLDVKSSAQVYFALYLKAHNPNSSPSIRNLYMQRLESFVAASTTMKALAQDVQDVPEYEKLKEKWDLFLKYETKRTASS